MQQMDHKIVHYTNFLLIMVVIMVMMVVMAEEGEVFPVNLMKGLGWGGGKFNLGNKEPTLLDGGGGGGKFDEPETTLA